MHACRQVHYSYYHCDLHVRTSHLVSGRLRYEGVLGTYLRVRIYIHRARALQINVTKLFLVAYAAE